MLTLGVDTATWTASVGLVRDGEVVAEKSRYTTASHGEHLFALVEAVLLEAGVTLSDVGVIAGSSGPGSFTGLRIGLSVVKGLAYAGGQKVVAVSTLEALARSAEEREGLVCACLDARKHEVYAALFRCAGERVDRLTPDMAIKPERLPPMISGRCLLIGDGAEVYREMIARRLGEQVWFSRWVHPRGGVVAQMGWERFCRGEYDSPGTLAPVYVRPPEVKLPSTLSRPN
jgi:tRNA threonylcarbamoyladenosine biosynthesis protein TsaB